MIYDSLVIDGLYVFPSRQLNLTSGGWISTLKLFQDKLSLQVCLDFSKEFDKVNHCLLATKLKGYADIFKLVIKILKTKY